MANRTTARTALLTWAKALARPVTVAEIKAKAKELRGRHFSESEFDLALSPVWHTEKAQCEYDSGTLCRPLFTECDSLWFAYFELINPIFDIDSWPADYELLFKVSEV